MEPRHYVSLAQWAKDRIARLESAPSDRTTDEENDQLGETNVLSFIAEAMPPVAPMQEAA